MTLKEIEEAPSYKFSKGVVNAWDGELKLTTTNTLEILLNPYTGGKDANGNDIVDSTKVCN